jgi:mono/diheme cytochrome c family protein
VALAAAVLGVAQYAGRPAPIRPVVTPALSPGAEEGRAAFARFCAACHGPAAGGSGTGPALVHRMYHPALHADVAFELAVRDGVRAHHWRFGDMPPIPAARADVARITEYLRALQKANGIY